MSSETIPEWAMEEAERILRHAEAPPTDGNLYMMSRALLDAEQRGLEKAAEDAKQHLEAAMLSADPYRHIRAAIRLLGDKT